MYLLSSWTLTLIGVSLVRITTGLAILLFALLAGCGTDAPSPVATVVPPSEELGSGMGVAGQWELTVDGAEVRLEPTRDAMTLRQQNLYWFDTVVRMRASDLQIRGVSFDPNGDVQIDYAVRHPFPAPDFTQPPSGKNRADLSFCGTLLILADLKPGQVPAHTFYGDVITHTEAVADPDGFLEPGTLMHTPAASYTTAFPYKLLVDELRDNREGVSNNGNHKGNYNAAAGGWQRFNIDNGGTANGWTGYDYLHQGQTATGSFTLRRQVLAQPGGFRCRLAVIIKYPDPKGLSPQIEPLARFPMDAPVDVHRFSHRLPYIAQDVSKIDLTAVAGDLSTLEGSQGNLQIAVRDWDATAAETTIANIGLDPNLSLVQIGGSGKPTVELHFPALSDAFFPAVSINSTDGTPANPLRFAVTLENLKGTATPGPIVGLVRVTDPEALLPDLPTYTFGVDAATLATNHGRYVHPITYQVLLIDLPQG